MAHLGRSLLVVACLAGLAPAAGADEDDPKGVRSGPAPATTAPVAPRAASAPPPSRPVKLVPAASDDEDDPKRARLAAAQRAPAPPPHPVPRARFAYRFFQAPGLASDTVDFHVIEVDLHPISRRWFRLGIDVQAGIASKYSGWYVTTGLSAGVQYPARVTPFLEGRFQTGVIGATYRNYAALSWVYAGGLEGGAELYLAGRFYLSAAVGWLHPVYEGIDGLAWDANPSQAPTKRVLSGDSVTVRVGFGL